MELHEALEIVTKNHLNAFKGYLDTKWISNEPYTVVPKAIPIASFPIEQINLSELFFIPEDIHLINQYNLPIFIPNTNQQAVSKVLRPTWVVEGIMNSVLSFSPWKHNLRPLRSDFVPWKVKELFEFPVGSIVEYIWNLYQTAKGTTIKNHWSVYPCLMTDVTPPFIFKDMVKRVSKDARLKILWQAMRLRAAPQKFYDWANQQLIMMNLESRVLPEVEAIKKLQAGFINECKPY